VECILDLSADLFIAMGVLYSMYAYNLFKGKSNAYRGIL
jgi:hypothetical protein